MKGLILSTLVTSFVLSITATALPIAHEVRTHDDVKDRLFNEVAKRPEEAHEKVMALKEIHDKLVVVSGKGAHSSMDTASLGSSFALNEGSVSVAAVAKSLIRSDAILKDSRIISNNIDAKAKELKEAIHQSNQTFSENLGLVAGKILKPHTSEGKAVAKVLKMGQEIAEGKLDAKEAHSYEKLMRGMSELLRTGQAKDSEQALEMALKAFGDEKDLVKKLEDCKG